MPLNLDAAAATSLCQLELSSPHRHLREHTMHMVIAGLCVPFGANGGFHELKCTPSYHGRGMERFPHECWHTWCSQLWRHARYYSMILKTRVSDEACLLRCALELT